MISLIVVIVLCTVALAAPLIAPYSPGQTHYGHQYEPIGSSGFLLGTDQLGRDILSRLIYGLRTALLVAIVAQIIVLPSPCSSESSRATWAGRSMLSSWRPPM